MKLHAALSSPAITAVRVLDHYLAPRITANHASTIPASLKQSYDTGRIDAFKLNWKEGMPKMPHVYWDSDVAKVVEGMAYDLALHPGDKALEDELEKIVALIVSAQQPDGYLNTHFTVVEPENRFKHLAWAHELYCCGHLIEAAVAHFKATGRRNFLDCMARYADYIDSVFGRGKGKKRGYPGHEELELALMKLAAVTGERRYARLASYFVNERGRKPNYYVTNEGATEESLVGIQADKTVRERKDATGHAVRMMYLACGMADVAVADGDDELLDRCRDVFDSVANRRMFITGGVGSTHHGEAFEGDYRLVNLEAYTESCAAMGLVWFAQRMHNITGETRYLDVLERALYNGALSGISLSGDRFFYMNPLDSNPDSHFIRERVPWFGTSCCPTNYCRFLPQIGTFLWSESDGEVRLNIPAASEFRSNGRALRVTGGYPYDGKVRIRLLADGDFTLSVRVPGWCEAFEVDDDGRLAGDEFDDGLLRVNGPWKKGDEIAIDFEMPVETVRANSLVHDDAGKVALTRGPLVYAFESVDNGATLGRLSLQTDKAFRLGKAKGLPAGTVSLSGEAVEVVRPGDALYSAEKPVRRHRKVTAIPFALWQNRGASEMAVWLHERV